MGMAASQGRLLMMTARISNNEFEQQCVAYSKQRLADDSQQANDTYLDALQATQYQVLVGYHGDTPQYDPVSYNVLTGFDNVATSKQYIVSDNTGKILVTSAIKQAFEDSKHNFNAFLTKVEKGKQYTQIPEKDITEGMVHDAWDRYLASVNRGVDNGIYDADDTRHIVGFSYNQNMNGDVTADYVTYETSYLSSGDKKIYLSKDPNNPSNYYYNNYKLEIESYIDGNGETAYDAYFIATADGQEDSKFYPEKCTVEADGNGGYSITFEDASGKTETKFATESSPVYVDRKEFDFNNGAVKFAADNHATEEVAPSQVASDYSAIFFEGATKEQRELYDYAMALSRKYALQYSNPDALVYDADKLQYYKNIYDQMTTNGFTTYDDMVKDKYINTESETEEKPFLSDEWLIRMIKQGKLVISFYSATEKDFVKTTLDDDESIVNKENKSKMAIAEQVYQSHMDRIEAQDKKFDMELTKLESEHTALLTEYEAVNKVISKNVEKSFGTFNA